MNGYVYYMKLSDYGKVKTPGKTVEGEAVVAHVGGVGVCPRPDCLSLIGMAQEQIEHRGDKHSVAHVGGHPTRAKCGAHFVTGDPEEVVTSWPHDLDAALEEVAACFHPDAIYRRPITWHGDV